MLVSDFANGNTVFSQFSKFTANKLFSAIKTERQMFLIIEKMEETDNTDDKVELKFIMTRYFFANLDKNYSFDAQKADDLRLKLRWTPNTKKTSILKLFAIKGTQKGYLSGYGRFASGDK